MESILGSTRKADVSFNANGRIDITARVSKMLTLAAGDVIDLGINDDFETYLYIKHRCKDIMGNHEAQVYATNKGASMNFRAHSIRLCRYVLKECKTNKARLPVGKPIYIADIGVCIPLITRNNLQK